MTDLLKDWKSFWDIASPQHAASVMAHNYGSAARQAALHCAVAAEADGRAEDSRFWRAVAQALHSNVHAAGTTAAAAGCTGRPGGADPAS